MRALVTGFAGFVGSHITQRCLDLGLDVTGVDDCSVGKRIRPRDLGLYEIMDVREWFRDNDADYDLVFHCAAIVGGRKNIDGAPLNVAVNLSIDSEFFNWCTSGQHKPRKVVYFSSSAVYPVKWQTRASHIPLNEPLVDLGLGVFDVPDQTYGWSKLTGEYLMHQAVRNYGLNCVCYRPFSGYGEDQDLDYPFPSLIRRVGRYENPIEIWGSGNQVRDFIHIDDIVDAVFDSCVKMEPGEARNLGSGIGTSFRELVEEARQEFKHSALVKMRTEMPEGVFSRVADMTKHPLNLKIGLREGIRRVHEWQKEHGLLDKTEEKV